MPAMWGVAILVPACSKGRSDLGNKVMSRGTAACSTVTGATSDSDCHSATTAAVTAPGDNSRKRAVRGPEPQGVPSLIAQPGHVTCISCGVLS